jgi:hypothetical protein
MNPIIEFLLKLFFVDLVYPLALELAMKRETDPAFKAESDKTYGEIKAAQTTADRKTAARKLYELQKNS